MKENVFKIAVPFIEVKAFVSFIRMKENVFKIAADSLSFTRMKDSLTYIIVSSSVVHKISFWGYQYWNIFYSNKSFFLYVVCSCFPWHLSAGFDYTYLLLK
jgi:hypothetical protein